MITPMLIPTVAASESPDGLSAACEVFVADTDVVVVGVAVGNVVVIDPFTAGRTKVNGPA